MAEFDRLLIFRALRPDRLTVAMRSFVAGVLGKEYITSRPFDLELACQVRIDVLTLPCVYLPWLDGHTQAHGNALVGLL